MDWYSDSYNNCGIEIDGVLFDPDMCKYCGKTAIITVKTKGYYKLSIDSGDWFWYDWMLEDEPTVSGQLKEKRFQAACSAMQGVISSGIYNLNDTDSIDDIVFDSYKLADELLKQGGFTE